MQVRWVLEDADRPGGVESVVRSLDGGLRDLGIASSVLSWNPGAGTDPPRDTGAAGWVRAKVGAARDRRAAASAVARELARDLRADPGLVVVLDPGSLAVARRLRGSPRWGLHLHWSPDLLLAPWRHVGGDGVPAVLAPVVQTRLRYVGRSNAATVRRAPFVVTLTGSHTDALRRLRPTIQEIPNPVAVPPRRKRAIPADGDPVTLGYVGRLSWEKGPDLLLRAMSLLASATGPVRLLVAGSGPAAAEVEQQVRADGRTDVQLLGWVDDPRSVLDGVDVLVLPSRTEAVPLILVQALGAGCRVVAADAGPGVRDLLLGGRLGQVVPVERPDELARAIERSVADVRAGRRPDDDGVALVIAAHDPERVLAAWNALLRKLTAPQIS